MVIAPLAAAFFKPLDTKSIARANPNIKDKIHFAIYRRFEVVNLPQ